MKRYITYAAICLLAVTMTGCSKWLDVQPYDKISEDELFSTESGFQRLLNGIYIDLNDDALYGRTLTVEMVELLAYNYKIDDDPTYWGDYINLRDRNFTSDYWRRRLDDTWNKAYALIRNCNTLLENMELHREVFTGDNYNLIRGEALALRALLHFDMFRLFGPVYKNDPEGISIPYCTTTDLQVQELLPANEVIQRLLDDLNEAARCLQNDPIFTDDPLAPAPVDGSVFTAYRALRLNYYAVQALLARVYYYAASDESSENTPQYVEKAIACADAVISSQKFPFVDRSLVLGSPENPDRIFHTECIFALTNANRGQLFKVNFDPSLVPRPYFTIVPSNLETIYFGGEYGGSTDDYRYIANWSKIGESYAFYKFADLPDVSLLRNTMIPMIRLGEMYLILADLYLQNNDKSESVKWVNLLREHRGVSLLRESGYIRARWEYELVRELYGEGQTFYYYKRNYRNITVKFSDMGDETVSRSEKLYVIPMPDTETENRQ